MKFFTDNDLYIESSKYPMKFYISRTGILHCQKVNLEGEENKLGFDIEMGRDEVETILYKLIMWSKLSGIDFILLRQIIIDSIQIADLINNDNNVKLKFVKSLMLFLQSFTHFDPLFSERLKDLKKYYFELCKKTEDIDYLEKLFAAEHYLDLCMNDDNQDWFDTFRTDSGEAQNREQEVEKIANFLIDLKREEKYKNNEKLDLLLQKARTWIMLRYDLDRAAYYQFHNHPFWLNVFKVLPEVCGFIILLALLTINNSFWLSIKSPIIQISEKVKIDNYGLLCLYAIFIIEGIILIKKIKAGMVQTQVFMPRIAGGIIVGYLAVLAEEMWVGIFLEQTSLFNLSSINWFYFAARIIIPLAVIYVYLLVEMSNVKGIEGIQKKAGRILARGFSYSLMIGVIICDLFGENMVQIVKQRFVQDGNSFSIIFFKGIFGNIYPEVILLLSPLALFIGVFLQLLWEDKAVTERI